MVSTCMQAGRGVGEELQACMHLEPAPRQVDEGEGEQWLVMEHRVQLGKLEGIFLARLCPKTFCGLPGMVLIAA